MEEDLLKLYNAVSSKFDIGNYEDFSSKMQTTEDRKKFYNVVGSKNFDLGDYNTYESRLNKTPKQEGVISESELFPNKQTEQKIEESNNEDNSRPKPTYFNDEQIKDAFKGSGLSDNEIKQRQDGLKKGVDIANSQVIKSTHEFKKDKYSEAERGGFFRVNKNNGETELIPINNKAENINVEGFDNEKMQNLTVKMRESALLTEDEIKNIDADIDRKKRGDFTIGEKFKIGVKKHATLIGDLFGLKDEAEMKQISSFDRQKLIEAKIEQKQSAFFDNLDNDERELFNTYLGKREEKISKKLKEADFINNYIQKFVIPKEIADFKSIDSEIKQLQSKKKEDITQEDVDRHKFLLNQVKEKEKQIEVLDQQYETNRNTIKDNLDDVLSFDRELDLAKRDYSWYANRPKALLKNVQFLGENILSFAGNIMWEAQKFNANPNAYNSESDSIFKDWSKNTAERKEEFEEGIRVKKRFSDVNGIEGFAEYGVNLITDQLPNYAILYATGGLGGSAVIGASSGGDRMGQLLLGKERGLNNYSFSDITKNSILYATSEAAFETFTGKMLGDYKRIFKSINKSKVLKDGFKESFKNTLNSTYKGILNANKEGLSEVGTGVGQWLADRDLGENRKLDLTEEYVSGLMMGGSHVALSITNYAVGQYSKYDNRKKVKQNTLKILETEKIINEGNFSKEVEQLFRNDIQKLEKENNSIINESVSDIKNLSQKDVSEITSINNKIRAIQITLQGKGESDLNSKEDVKNSLLSKIKELSNQKDEILKNPKSEKFNSLPKEEKQTLKDQATKELVSEKQEKGEKEFEITDTEITEKAIELSNKETPENKEIVAEQSNISNPQSNKNETETPTTKETKSEVLPKQDDTKTEVEVNEVEKKVDIIVDENVQSGNITDNNKRQNENIQPAIDNKTSNKPIEVKETVKRINPKKVKGEFDVTFNEKGIISKITTSKGKKVEKFIESTSTKGKKYITKNPNYSLIESEITGTKTENQIRIEEKQKLNNALDKNTPSDAYGFALDYLARNNKIDPTSVKKETGLTDKEAKWATFSNKKGKLPSIEGAAEYILANSEQELDMQDVRNALIDILTSNSSVKDLQQNIIEQIEALEKQQQNEELEVYLNSLSEKEFANYEANKVENDYFSEISDIEALQYLEEQYGSKQQKESFGNDERRTTITNSVQKRDAKKEETTDVSDRSKPKEQGSSNQADSRMAEIGGNIRRSASKTKGERKITLHEQQDLEAKSAIDIAEKEGLWIDNSSDLGEPFSSGHENNNYLNNDEKQVYKVNNLANSNTISELFKSMETHNEMFPETPYEFVGFTGDKNRLTSIQPIFKQKLIDESIKAEQSEIDSFMADSGFKNTTTGAYVNGEYLVFDLFPRNVLKDKNGVIYVIDVEFKKIEDNETKPTKDELKKSAFDKIDNLAQKLKDALPGISDSDIKPNGFTQDQLIDLMAKSVKFLVGTGIDINEAIKQTVASIKEKLGIDIDPNDIKARLEKSEPKKPKPEKKTTSGDKNKQAFSTRAFKSENLNKETKSKLEKLGLDYSVESQITAENDGKKIIKEFGLLESYRMAKNLQIRGGAKIYIQSQMFDALNQQIYDAQQKGENDLADDLIDELSTIMKEFANEKTLMGQEISMLNRIYKTSDIKYDLEFAKLQWEKKFDSKMSPQIEARLKLQAKKIKNRDLKIKELEEKIGTLEEQTAVNDIQSAVKRHKRIANKTKFALSKEEQARKRQLKNKFFGTLNDVSRIATLLADPEFREYLALVFKSAKGDLQNFAVKVRNEIGVKSKKVSKQLFEEANKEFNKSINKKLSGANENSNGIKIPSDLIYDLVESGIDNITDLTNAVHEVLKEQYANLTHREVRDAITGYGKQVSETQDDVKKKISSLKTDGKQISALDDLADNKRPKRSGRKPRKLTAEQRNRVKKIRELLKTLPFDDTTDKESFYKTALEGYKTRVKNRIKDLNEAINKGERIINERRSLPLDQEAKTLIEQRDKLQKEYDDTFGKPYKSDETLINEIVARKERQLKDLQTKSEYIKLNKAEQPKSKKREVSDPEIDKLDKLIESAREELSEVLDEVGIAEQKRLARAKKYVERSINELKRRINERDFAPKKPRKVKYDKELIELKRQQIVDKAKYDIEFEKQELREMGASERLLDATFKLFGTFKGLKATFDLSAMLRQGAFLGVGNPKEFAKATVDMHKFVASSKEYKTWMAEVESSPDFVYMMEDGLSITDTSGDVLRSEERFVGNLISKIPVIGKFTDASERAYGGFLNSLRISAYRKLVKQHESLGYTREKNPKEFKRIAYYVNGATGRGKLGSDKNVAKVANIVFFSPRMITGMWSVTNTVFNPNTTKSLRKESIKSLAAFVGYQYLSKLLLVQAYSLLVMPFTGEDDEDVSIDYRPTSTDFNKLRIGETRYDLSAGYGIAIRTLARLYFQEKANNIDSDSKEFDGFMNSVGSESMKFLWNKTSPLYRQIWNYHTNEHPNDIRKDIDDATAYDYFEALFVPLTLQELFEAIENDTPKSKIVFDTLLTIYGVGVQTYDSGSSKETTTVYK